jgi:glucose/mannose-6-phosphate isomerase
MLALLLDFPGQLGRACEITRDVKFARAKGSISNVVFSGLGGSAIGGDLIKCFVADEIKVPFVINRDYGVPAFVNSKTLFFASSYSGNTEETASAYKEARRKKAKIVVLSSAGQLERMARLDGYPVVKVPEKNIPPRCALAYSFIPALDILAKVGLIGDKNKDINETIEVIGGLRDGVVGIGTPFRKNPAKKTAAILFKRFGAIYGWSRHLDCAATRWRNQLCENSKSLATSHFLPEMNHNEIMGFNHPKKALRDVVVIFLRDAQDHARIKDRIDITSRILKDKVYKVIEIESEGKGLLSRICSLIYIGDFVSFYLAVLNGEDPTPVNEITYLKKKLSKK